MTWRGSKRRYSVLKADNAGVSVDKEARLWLITPGSLRAAIAACPTTAMLRLACPAEPPHHRQAHRHPLRRLSSHRLSRNHNNSHRTNHKHSRRQLWKPQHKLLPAPVNPLLNSAPAAGRGWSPAGLLARSAARQPATSRYSISSLPLNTPRSQPALRLHHPVCKAPIMASRL